jgi:hypothetical protein
MYHVRKLIESVEAKQDSISQLYGLPEKWSRREQPVTLNLHINNYDPELGQAFKNAKRMQTTGASFRSSFARDSANFSRQPTLR